MKREMSRETAIQVIVEALADVVAHSAAADLDRLRENINARDPECERDSNPHQFEEVASALEFFGRFSEASDLKSR